MPGLAADIEALPRPDFDPLPQPEPEPRQTSGITTRLVLLYVERECGRTGVDDLLGRAGLGHREAELMDENSWFSFETKIRLFEAAVQVLGDPRATRRIGAAAIELRAGAGLKVVLRALGSPRLVYQNVVRANAKFNTVHSMEVFELSQNRAKIEFRDSSGVGIDHLDCEYNKGLLSCVPALFGHRPATVSHPMCACDGAEACVYDISWHGHGSELRYAAGCGAAAITAIAAPLVIVPALVPLGMAVATVAGGAAVRRGAIAIRRRWQRLEDELAAVTQTADQLTDSLHDLVSDLRPDEVLDKITRHAKSAVGGNEYALLVASEDGRWQCRSSECLPEPTARALERWAGWGGRALADPLLLDDLADVPELRAVAENSELPLRSMCAAPLMFRGEALGTLIALSNAEQNFLPRDVERLQAYANQGAIALANARLFEAQQELASRDPLTNLLNHREFHESVAREIERCRRHGGEFSVALFDLDAFKAINDGAGHAEGDRVLRAIGHAIEGSCRASDLAFRVGGDEFALLLPVTAAENATTAAVRARTAINAQVHVGTSYGVASWPVDGEMKDELLATADRRLYAMKGTAAPGVLERPIRAVAGPPPAEAGSEHRRRLAFAHRLSTELMPLRESDEIGRATVAELTSGFGYGMAALHKRDEQGLLHLVASAGEHADVDHEVNWRVARTGEAAIVPSTGSDQLRSGLAIPIRVAGRVWGVLDLYSHSPNAFEADDLLLGDTVAVQVGAALHRAELIASIETSFMTTLGTLCDVLEAKDSYTADHSGSVAELSERVAARMGLEGDEVRAVRYAGLLHDIGKVGVRTELLAKPGRLTREEFDEIKEHAALGARLLEQIPFFENVHPLVRSTHERWDGDGYPDGLSGEAIPLGARIIGACDAFHAMTSERPYRAATSREVALTELRASAGTQFDPAVVEAVVAEVS
ncbi:MAG TPA: HD domain-containing phosphohydrolase [Thermoleophilaceae bacterium]|nr:HD domain-containing phosphohydrolase [Thermoleophilaceae bacterium]